MLIGSADAKEFENAKVLAAGRSATALPAQQITSIAITNANLELGDVHVVIQDPRSGEPLAVMDTKYKVGEAPVEADVNQVVAYAVEMGVNRAFLVYPSAAGASLKAKLGYITVEGLSFDIGADYEQEGRRFREELLLKLAA